MGGGGGGWPTGVSQESLHFSCEVSVIACNEGSLHGNVQEKLTKIGLNLYLFVLVF